MTTETYTEPSVVRIHGIENSEPGLLNDVLTRIKQYQRVQSVDIHVQSRVPDDAPPHKHPGWAEYLLQVVFADGGKLTVGAIQRTHGAPTEFHS